MLAAINGRLPVIEYLLERGADLNGEDNVNEQLNIDLLRVTLGWHCSEERVHCTVFVVVTSNFTTGWRLLQRC